MHAIKIFLEYVGRLCLSIVVLGPKCTKHMIVGRAPALCGLMPTGAGDNCCSVRGGVGAFQDIETFSSKKE